MINGIMIFDNGMVQQIGELQTLETIITTMQVILPELIKKEQERKAALLSDEDIEKLYNARKNKKQEVIEP